MAFDDMLLVGNSSVYDLEGFGKAILTRIAHLIIGYPEEDEQGKPKTKPHPDAGWCTATQDYIAAFLGCSESVVQIWCKRFVKDGWLETKMVRNRFGHNRNYYAWKAGAVKRLEQLQMTKGADGRFLRAAKPNKKNQTSFGNLDSESGNRLPNSIGLTARCRLASRQGAVSPDRKKHDPSPHDAGRGVRAGSPACVVAGDDSATATHTSKIKTNPNTQTSGLRPEPAREDFSPSRTHPGKDSSNTTQAPAAPASKVHRSHKLKEISFEGKKGETVSFKECELCLSREDAPIGEIPCAGSELAQWRAWRELEKAKGATPK